MRLYYKQIKDAARAGQSPRTRVRLFPWGRAVVRERRPGSITVNFLDPQTLDDPEKGNHPPILNGIAHIATDWKNACLNPSGPTDQHSTVLGQEGAPFCIMAPLYYKTMGGCTNTDPHMSNAKVYPPCAPCSPGCHSLTTWKCFLTVKLCGILKPRPIPSERGEPGP